ncbi:MAG TPA: imidazolonepropionase [Gemmatimonadales bacterium]
MRHPTADHLGIRTGIGVGIESEKKGGPYTVAMLAPDYDLLDWLHHLFPQKADEFTIDCGGRLITPGLVDCHTHAVFGKPRLEDQARRARGEDYKAIAAAGGGILSSVADFRTRGEDELVALTRARLARLTSLGTTTVEVKSGYGLSAEAELKALRVIRRVAGELGITLVPTFLGAHEVPADFRSRRDAYVRLVIEEMLPAVAREKLARFCDVFCEPGVFALDETAAILSAASALGLKAKLHADELDPAGGAELAAKLGATSADHLGAVSARGVEALAGSSTVAVLLPGTLTFLGKSRQAPARALLEAGAIVALATDFNPGSSPTGNLPLILALAVSQGRMQPEEALIAATVNAAWAAGEDDDRGRLRVGGRADLVVWNCRDWRELSYWYGMPLAREVYAAGRPCLGPFAGISSADSGADELLSPRIF